MEEEEKEGETVKALLLNRWQVEQIIWANDDKKREQARKSSSSINDDGEKTRSNNETVDGVKKRCRKVEGRILATGKLRSGEEGK